MLQTILQKRYNNFKFWFQGLRADSEKNLQILKDPEI
jgi:hypothetical protein